MSNDSELELHPWHEPSKYKEPDYKNYGTIFGEINAKGEKDILPMDTQSFIRLRYNQFFSFLKENMIRNIEN